MEDFEIDPRERNNRKYLNEHREHEDTITQADLIRNLMNKMDKLYDLLGVTSDKIVGWTVFNEFKKEMSERMSSVENVCKEYNVEKKHLVDATELVKSQKEVTDQITKQMVPKETFDAFVTSYKDHNEKIEAILFKINSKLQIFDMSFCTFKYLLRNRVFLLSIILVLFIVVSLAFNDATTLIGRLHDYHLFGF